MHVLCIKYIVVVANLAPRAVQLNRKKYISPVHVVFAPKNLVSHKAGSAVPSALARSFPTLRL